jgi:integrase
MRSGITVTAASETTADTTGPRCRGRAVKPPKYRRHKRSGQAVATFGGRDFYLGAFGSKASKAEYRRRLAEWNAAGCPDSTPSDPSALTVVELIERYWGHVKTYYPNQTQESTIKPTLRRLRRLYGPTLATEFGPLAMKAFQRALIDERITLKDGGTQRLSRPYVNRALQWVRRMFKWAVGEELVPVSVLAALQAVEGLKAGRTDAPEPPPVKPVADATIDATLPHLTPVVADMIRVQRLTGMRPKELCSMTTAELDMSGDVWVYRPSKHKTQHHGKTREIVLGPKAQAILRPYLTGRRLNAPLFSPADAEAQRKAMQRANRKTPLTPSQRARDERNAAKPKRKYRPAYDTTNYGQAIRRACDAAGIPRWAPNQIRHTRATELRREFGLDAAGAVLGHAKLETTQIYAEKNQEQARRVALATG